MGASAPLRLCSKGIYYTTSLCDGRIPGPQAGDRAFWGSAGPYPLRPPRPAAGGIAAAPSGPSNPLRTQTSFAAKKWHPCHFLALRFCFAKTYAFITVGIHAGGAPARLKSGLHLAGINIVVMRRAGVTFFSLTPFTRALLLRPMPAPRDVEFCFVCLAAGQPGNKT